MTGVDAVVHLAWGFQPSRDVDYLRRTALGGTHAVIRAVRRAEVPHLLTRLSQVAAAVSGEGLTVEVRFVKKDGLPVHLVKADEPVDAAAVRVVDLQRKYHRSPTDLAAAVHLSHPKTGALRAHLGIDVAEDCRHVFDFSSQRHVRYSDNAYTRMRDALAEGLDMAAVWAAHGRTRRRGPRPVCTQPGCTAAVKAS